MTSEAAKLLTVADEDEELDEDCLTDELDCWLLWTTDDPAKDKLLLLIPDSCAYIKYLILYYYIFFILKLFFVIS